MSRAGLLCLHLPFSPDMLARTGGLGLPHLHVNLVRAHAPCCDAVASIPLVNPPPSGGQARERRAAGRRRGGANEGCRG